MRFISLDWYLYNIKDRKIYSQSDIRSSISIDDFQILHIFFDTRRENEGKDEDLHKRSVPWHDI